MADKKKKSLLNRISTGLADALYTPVMDFNGMQKLSNKELSQANHAPDQIDALGEMLKKRLGKKVKVTTKR